MVLFNSGVFIINHCVHILICDLEGKVSELHVLSKNIQHSDHLGEDQDTMAGLSQANQQLV